MIHAVSSFKHLKMGVRRQSRTFLFVFKSLGSAHGLSSGGAQALGILKGVGKRTLVDCLRSNA